MILAEINAVQTGRLQLLNEMIQETIENKDEAIDPEEAHFWARVRGWLEAVGYEVD
jgi:hypothetical protein